MSTFCHWMIENSIDNILHRVMHASVSTASWSWRGQWTRLFLLSNDLVCWSYIVCSCFCFSTKLNVHIVIIVLKHKFEEEGTTRSLEIVLAITGELRYNCDGYPYVPPGCPDIGPSLTMGCFWLRLILELVNKMKKVAFPSVQSFEDLSRIKRKIPLPHGLE